MAITQEIVAITGKYTGQDGKEKNRYTKLGVVMETKNGLMLKLETIPLQWDGWAYLNDPKPKEAKPAGTVADMTDDIPF